MGGLSEVEANELAGKLFPQATKVETPTLTQATSWEKTDDWGFPVRVNDDTIASVAKTLNIPSPSAAPPVTPPSAVTAPSGADLTADREKKEKRVKNAKSIMDMIGIAGAAGDVMLARKMCERVGKEPLKPDPKQVNDLRESIKDTLTEWFGDKEIAPWQMMILLGLGLPLTMLIQSPKRPEKKTDEAKDKPDLKSVP